MSELDLRDHLIELRPEDIAAELEGWSADQVRTIISLLPDQVAAEVIAESETRLARTILEIIENERIPRILGHLDPDDAADLLGYLDARIPDTPQADEVLAQLEAPDRDSLRKLLVHDPDTAGGLMTTAFVTAPVSGSLDDALAAIRSSLEAETIYIVYVLDASSRLVGTLSVRDILRNAGTAPIAEHMTRAPLTLKPTEDQEDVANSFERHNLGAMPVVDDEGMLLGVVTVDDVIDVLSEEAEKDILAIAGVPLTHQTLEPVTARVSSRLPWLMVTLVSGLFIAWMISGYEGLIAEFAVLALFQPVVLGLGGSVGLQSSTIIVRGLAIDEIDRRRMWKVAGQEFMVGLLVGLACGIVIALATQLVASLLHADSVAPWRFGMVVGVSVAVGMTISATIGTIIPLLLERLDVDPALAAGPFITVLSDLSSLLVYFSVASILLHGP